VKLNFKIPEDIKKTIDSNKNIIDDFFAKINKDKPEFNDFTLHLSL
jgi:hypothetical protein